ncbi:ABC-F family ATP-binding cassette domain-containing protein [Allokutzneria oryzae]|uniref:ABC-F family ATP-binding cassette domain-containing protein n=1 Tax=Allokutzneria oryzae TaxID=1378989 RepID=A0ABV5ZR49_9PSEU
MRSPRRQDPHDTEVLADGVDTAHLVAENLVCVLGDRTVLADVSVTVAAGERLGLIGENGHGKSTLLRTLAGRLPPQRGHVLRAVPGRTGFLPQEPDFPVTATISDVLVEANAALDELAEAMRAAERAMETADEARLPAVLAEYGRAQEEFGRRGGWERDARVGEVLAAFGLADIPVTRPVAELAGGERSRLALAALILAEPAALLLDEPTNHLDDAAVEWLRSWLTGTRSPCLIASHDRAFLDTAVTGILDLDGPRGELTRHGGGYRDYLAAQRAARQRWELRYREWREAVDQARHRIENAHRTGGHDRVRTDGPKMAFGMRGDKAEVAVARTTRAARLQLARLLDEAVPRPPRPLSFTPPASGSAAVEATGIVVGDVLRGVDLVVRQGELMVITAPNGAGKSTLLRVLAGELTPDRGTVTVTEGARIGYLAQETSYPDPSRALLEVYRQRRELHAEDAEAELLRFGLFRRRDLTVPVDRLSVGQRRRLHLAELFAGRPDLLLLDEPTNHLSLMLVEQLQEAVEGFAGAVLLATHDRSVRDRHAHRVRRLVEGRLEGTP